MPRSPWLASAGWTNRRRRTGGGERRRDLVADMAVLAHARDHDAAGALGQHVDGLNETVAEAEGEGADTVGLEPQHAAGHRQVVMRPGLAAALGCAGLDDCRHRICSLSSFTHEQALACARPANRRWWHGGRDANRPIGILPQGRHSGGRPSMRPTTTAIASIWPQWAKISTSAQPARSSSARAGRKSKQAWASDVRPSRASISSSLALRACR